MTDDTFPLITTLIDTIVSFVEALGAKEHQGYAYGLGADSWTAGGYSGAIQSWSLKPNIRW